MSWHLADRERSLNMRMIGFPSLTFASLLPIVLLGGCVSNSEYDAVQRQNAQLQRQLTARSNKPSADKVQATRRGTGILYTIYTDLAFAPGSWQLTANGKDVIEDIAEKLAGQQQNLIVTGYTDNVPVGAGLATEGVTSNQILSEYRASAVMDYMVAQGVRHDMITARGMGEQKPAVPNTSAAGRALNRRIVISTP